eukprot:6783219-Alexandrium_andersonii.AAC.1
MKLPRGPLRGSAGFLRPPAARPARTAGPRGGCPSGAWAGWSRCAGAPRGEEPGLADGPGGTAGCGLALPCAAPGATTGG